MRILISPDSFKESLSSSDIANLLRTEIQIVKPEWELDSCPISDGGDGYLSVLQFNGIGEKVKIKIRDPLFREIESHFLVDDNTAYLEMALSCGLGLLEKSDQNCFFTSSIGLGDTIKQIPPEVKYVFITLGGSSTCDAGIGMGHSLGYKFESTTKQDIVPIGKNLREINKITHPSISQIKQRHFFGLCDVKNPLYGPNGSAQIYGPQKGANPEQVKSLDNGLKHIATIFEKDHEEKISAIPGSGAAGGMGAGIIYFLNGKLEPGFNHLIKKINLEDRIKKSDVIITGEGKFDKQSLSGKVVGNMIQLAHKYDKPILVICGQYEKMHGPYYDKINFLSINKEEYSLEQNMGQTHQHILKKTELIVEMLEDLTE